MEAMQDNELQLKSNFYELDAKRSDRLDLKRLCSRVTIPYIFPSKDHDELTEYSSNFSNFGSKSVINLSSKLMMTLLPPNAPFFRLSISNKIMKAIQDPSEKQKLEDELVNIEDKVLKTIEEEQIRQQLANVITYLLIVGDVLVQKIKNKGIMIYRLDNYVISRDRNGVPLKIILRDTYTYETLPKKFKALYEESDLCSTSNTSLDTSISKHDKHSIEVFTGICLNEDTEQYDVYSEIANDLYTEGSYKKDELPFLPLRWSSLPGEDYGRSFVENHLGALIEIENLSKSISDVSAITSQIFFLVKPGATAKIPNIRSMKNGDFLRGDKDDINAVRIDKGQDFQMTLNQISKLEQDLAEVFLSTKGSIRNAERVTAEEIRTIATELEQALGGVFSTLSVEFQSKLVKLILKEQNLQLDKNIKLTITSGFEALGRGQDFSKIQTMMQSLQGIVGPEQIAQVLNLDNLVSRISNSLGIDVKGLIKSKEDIQREQLMQQLQQLTSNPQALQAMMGQNQQQGTIDNANG